MAEPVGPRWRVTKCEFCPARVIWTKTTTGDRLLVDADPAMPAEGKRGALLTDRGVDGSGRPWPPLAEVITSRRRMFGRPVYRRHLDTCPRADYYRDPHLRRDG